MSNITAYIKMKKKRKILIFQKSYIVIFQQQAQRLNTNIYIDIYT
jgi:hypothetical protein